MIKFWRDPPTIDWEFRIGRWTVSGFLALETSLEIWIGVSLFRFPIPPYMQSKTFVMDINLPGFDVRLMLDKDKEVQNEVC